MRILCTTRRIAAGIAACVALLDCAAWAQRNATVIPARRLVTQRIDETKLVPLRGNTRPEATAGNDTGALPEDFPIQHVLIQLQRPVEREQALLQRIDQLHDPASPEFHHWMSMDELGVSYGPAAEDRKAIVDWLESHGLTVNVAYTSGMMIDFSGTAAQIRDAFRTELHRLNVNGAAHIANMTDPQIPAALAPAIVGVVSLHDFKPRPLLTPRPSYTVSSNEQLVVPADLATIYNMNPVFNGGNVGAGQTIVVIEDTDLYTSADWTTFRSTFGLDKLGPSASLTTVHPAPQSGTNNCKTPVFSPGDAGEAILDAEYSSAAAPGAAIVVAACGNYTTTFGGLVALANLIESPNPPAIVSISYGECEAENGAAANAAFSYVYQLGVARGTSIFVSSGDEDGASCDAGFNKAWHGIGVSGFASTLFNVAVGGTDFGDTFAGTTNTYWNTTNSPVFGSAKSYIPEIPWNDSCASVLLSEFVTNSAVTYGTSGFCNSTTGEQNFLGVVGGSGGPSGCATGSPSTAGVVSGTCAGWPKPAWQKGLSGMPQDGVRDIPDISLFAANGLWGHYYPFCYSDTAKAAGGAPCTGAPSTWAGAGGTSFASPILAGIQALVNAANGGAQGDPNYTYYRLAAKASPTTWCNSSNGVDAGAGCIFYDVTQGDIDVVCVTARSCYDPSGTNGVLSTSDSSYSIAFGTTKGWDFSSGIGSVNAANLVANWKK